MDTNGSQAIKLNSDDDFIRAVWYRSQGEVMDVLNKMRESGWTVCQGELYSIGEDGPVIARPVKLNGNHEYTGIATWKTDKILEV